MAGRGWLQQICHIWSGAYRYLPPIYIYLPPSPAGCYRWLLRLHWLPLLCCPAMGPLFCCAIAVVPACTAVALLPVVLRALPRHGGCLVSCCSSVAPLPCLSPVCYPAVLPVVPVGCLSSCLLLLSLWYCPCPLRCRPSSVSPSCSSPRTTPPEASETCTGWVGSVVWFPCIHRPNLYRPLNRVLTERLSRFVDAGRICVRYTPLELYRTSCSVAWLHRSISKRDGTERNHDNRTPVPWSGCRGGTLRGPVPSSFFLPTFHLGCIVQPGLSSQIALQASEIPMERLRRTFSDPSEMV